ncbi:MAG: hypothetical protein M3Y62_06320 [Candidatus Dormibacteraeota bacterium]|nr:hypothetical protein [Candidatus Dormibacteraeota bacterium]
MGDPCPFHGDTFLELAYQGGALALPPTSGSSNLVGYAKDGFGIFVDRTGSGSPRHAPTPSPTLRPVAEDLEFVEGC